MDLRTHTRPDRTTLAYRVTGRGPAVVLLHGFTQWSEMWISNGVAAALSAERTVYLPDRRGHGMSDRPKGPERYGHQMVEDVIALLDAEGIDSADLVGFSQGAEIALAASVEWPERVSSLLLIGSGWSGDALDEARLLYDAILEWVPDAIAKRRTWLTPDPDPAVFEAIAASILEIIDIPRSRIEALSVPAAGIVGSEDEERANLERLVGLLPGYTLSIQPGLGHGDSWSDPSLPDRVRTFLGLSPLTRAG
ncbi:MAG: alpha/beta fold hydrolase [Pseudomonadota bacterium]